MIRLSRISRRAIYRPALEALEDRVLPDANHLPTITNAAFVGLQAPYKMDVELGHPPDAPAISVTGLNLDFVNAVYLNDARQFNTILNSTSMTIDGPRGLVFGNNKVQLEDANGNRSNIYSFTLYPKQPVLTFPLTFNPAPPMAGKSFTINVAGRNFTNDSKVTISPLGDVANFTYTAGPQHFNRLIDITMTAPAGVYQLNITNPLNQELDANGFSTLIEVDNPEPSITGLTPSTITRDNLPVVVRVNGADFAAGAKVQLNNTRELTPDFIASDGSYLLVTISDLAGLSEPVSLRVVNPEPLDPFGDGISNSVTLVEDSSPPVISSLDHVTAPAGTGAFDLTITGSHFSSNSVVHWDSTVLTPKSVTRKHIVVTIPDTLLANPSSATIAVGKPSSSGELLSNTKTFTIFDPALDTISISPAIITLTPGSQQNRGLSVTGDNFLPTSVVLWNLTPLDTSYSDSHRVTCIIPADMLREAGTASISVRTPNPDGGVRDTAAVTFTFKNPRPNLEPSFTVLNVVTHIGEDFFLDVHSTSAEFGFVHGVNIAVNGVPLLTTRVSLTEAFVTVPASMLRGPIGQVDFTVTNPEPNDGIAIGRFFLDYPPTTISALHTSGAVVGADALVWVTGTGFVEGVTRGTVLRQYDTANGYTMDVDAAVLSPTELLVKVPAAALGAIGGNITLYVYNPSPGGGSANADFEIANPIPVLGTLDHTWVRQFEQPGGSGPSSTVLVTGAGFVKAPVGSALLGTQVLWNDQPIETTVGSSTQLVFYADLSEVGTATITVRNPGPGGGGSSDQASFVVLHPLPHLQSSHLDNVFAAGAADSFSFTENLRGLGFLPGATVRWNGQSLPTTYVSEFHLKFVVTGAQLTTPGTVTVDVLNGDGQASDTTTLTRVVIVNPQISGASPASAVPGGPGFTLTVDGQYFVPGATIRWKDEDRPTTYVSNHRLLADISAADIAAGGVGYFQVVQPDGKVSSSYAVSLLPVLTGISPASIDLGTIGDSVTLTLTGEGFVDNFSNWVRLSDSGPRPRYEAVWQSPTQVTVLLYRSDLQGLTSGQIRLVHDDGWLESNALALQIIPSQGHFAFTTAEQTLMAGVKSNTITVELQDDSGNPMPAGPGGQTINLSTSSAGGVFRDAADTTTITSVLIPAGSNTASFKYMDIAAGVATLAANATGLSGAVQQVSVTAGVAARLGFSTGPLEMTAGVTSGLMTVELQDAFGNAVRATSSKSVKLITSAKGLFRNTADTQTIKSITIPAGSSTVSFKYKGTKAGNPTLTASARGLLSTTQQETVRAAAAIGITFATTAHTITAGVVSGVLTVKLLDAFGNFANAGNGGQLLSLGTTSAWGVFRDPTDGLTISNVAIAAGSNSADFKYLDTKVGAPVLTVSAGSLTSAIQTEKVLAAAADHLAFTTTAQTLVAGASSKTITLQLQDAFGNAVNADKPGQSVNLSTTSAKGVFRSTSVLIAKGRSTVSFKYKDTLAGTPSLTASATGLASATQQQIVNAAAAARYAFLSPPVVLNAGVTSDLITVQLQDRYGNVVNAAGSGRIVKLATSSRTGLFRNEDDSAVITSVTIAAGTSTARFRYVDSAAGTPKLTAATAGLTSATQLETIL